MDFRNSTPIHTLAIQVPLSTRERSNSWSNHKYGNFYQWRQGESLFFFFSFILVLFPSFFFFSYLSPSLLITLLKCLLNLFLFGKRLLRWGPRPTSNLTSHGENLHFGLLYARQKDLVSSVATRGATLRLSQRNRRSRECSRRGQFNYVRTRCCHTARRKS